MATPSRNSSILRSSLSQRPSLSRLSNPDVFSDDYALSRGNTPDGSPVDFTESSPDTPRPLAISHPLPPPRMISASTSSHLNTPNFSRPTSTSKRPFIPSEERSTLPHRAVSSVSQSDAATHRSSSVSSRLSIPRPQSPYTGPTAPSQPYAMYPQVTRASSIASESTIRPIERPYVSTGGPEHPYGMYPQNTVEEEEDNVIHHPIPIPLGFPGMGENYRGQASGSDLADIVGHDGHVEQLPPYTRYADNTIAKGSNENVPVPVAADAEIPFSPISQTGDSETNVNVAAARDVGGPSTDYNEKSKTRQRLGRKACLGLSVCVWLLVATVVVLAATLGGVIGGVIGNNRAAEAASDITPTATTTVWLDAAPLPTNVPPPDCTPGTYNIPTTNRTVDASGCIADFSKQAAWGCLYDEDVPFTIKYVNSSPQILLGRPDVAKSGQGLRYGAQIPDLNSTFRSLGPSLDKDDPNAGGAMYFQTLYNKLTIALGVNAKSKKSITAAYLETRDYITSPVAITDRPYFCWFNQTLIEFFIYANLPINTTGSSSSILPTTTPTPTTYGSAKTTSMLMSSGTSFAIAQITVPTYTVGYSWPTWPPDPVLDERQLNSPADSYPVYPKQIRLAEKRAPSGLNVQPYCIQMEIAPDWSLCPIDGTYIPIIETEPHARRWHRSRSTQSTNNLDSDCACQWYNT